MKLTQKTKHIAWIAVIVAVILVATTIVVTLKKGSTYQTYSGFDGPVSFAEDSSALGRAVSKVASSFITPSPELFTETDESIDQKVIKNASLTLLVDSTDKSSVELKTITESNGGFIQNANFGENEDGSRYGSVTLRLPTDKFDTAINAIKALALVVESESINASDVTESYVDLTARLKNARSEEEAYLAVLERAQTVEDILKVQEALGNIRYRIESIEGQLQYLDSQVDMSTISVYLTEEASVVVPSKNFRPFKIIKEAAQAFVATLQWAVTAFIWVVVVGGGILIPLSILAWIIRAGVRRFKNRR